MTIEIKTRIVYCEDMGGWCIETLSEDKSTGVVTITDVTSINYLSGSSMDHPNIKSKIEDFVHLLIGVNRVLETIMEEDIVDHYTALELLKNMDRSIILKYIMDSSKK